MSWNLFAAISRIESGEVVFEAGCHEIGGPAVKRCFVLVYQTAISDEGCFAFASGVALAEANIFAGAKELAPNAPRPKAEVLINDLREFRLFVCFMLLAIVSYLSSLWIGISTSDADIKKAFSWPFPHLLTGQLNVPERHKLRTKT